MPLMPAGSAGHRGCGWDVWGTHAPMGMALVKPAGSAGHHAAWGDLLKKLFVKIITKKDEIFFGLSSLNPSG